MPNPRCAFCDVEITLANDSREHIIQNAIGGIRKVRGVFCKTCNNTTGAKWDAEAARQLQFLTLHLGVVRDRGNGCAGEFVTLSGRPVRKHQDGHLSFPASKPSVIPKGEGVQIQLQATTRAEAAKTLNGLKRTYPKLDVDAALASIDESDTYLSEPIKSECRFGGGLSGRSIVKTALTLAVSTGAEAKICNLALPYLRDNNGNPAFGYYYRRDLVTNRPTDRVFHCVAIKGDPSTGKLIGYVELFSVYRMVIGLSDQYTSSPMAAGYAIDPTVGEELNLTVDLTFTDEELRFALGNEDELLPRQLEAFDTVMGIAQRLSFEREQRRVAGKAYREALGTLGLTPGQEMTQEIALALSKEISRNMMPFLLHRAASQRCINPFPTHDKLGNA